MHTSSPPGWDAAAFARALQSLKDLGHTASALASFAQVSRPQVSRWASGAHRPGYDALRRLSEAVLDRGPAEDVRPVVADLCTAAGYPGIAAGLGALPSAPDDDAVEDVTSPYTGTVWRVVKSLESHAEDAGLTQEEEREMIEAAMVEAEKRAELIADSVLGRRLRRQRDDE